MADGTGVPNMQPDLTRSAVVKGSPRTFVSVVLRGPASVLPASRKKYSNAMPPMSSLNDSEVASVVTYVRNRFGGAAGRVTAAQVAAVRAGKAVAAK
jgi:mono/diheme cytochrome c family protein